MRTCGERVNRVRTSRCVAITTVEWGGVKQGCYNSKK
jgi:hypothetical protein